MPSARGGSTCSVTRIRASTQRSRNSSGSSSTCCSRDSRTSRSIELSERLAALAPPGLGHAFYGSDGASATEIALKMAFHYWKNRGHPEKTGFRLARRQLSRRDARRARGHRRGHLSRHVRAAAHAQRDGGLAGRPRRRARRDGARRRDPRGARARSAPRRPSRDDRRIHRRAARAGRVGNGDVRSALPRRGARAVHALRCAA